MNIIPNKALATFNFGNLAGQKQTKERNDNIHNTIINSPDQPMAGEGESWNQAYGRVVPTVKDIVNNSPANTTLVTHNSVFGLIKQASRKNFPDEFSQMDRKAYVLQDGKHKTGDSFTISGKNGPIHIVRHGETTDNTAGNFRSDDAQLTNKGVEQAKSLGKKFRNKDIQEVIT